MSPPACTCATKEVHTRHLNAALSLNFNPLQLGLGLTLTLTLTLKFDSRSGHVSTSGVVKPVMY